MVGGGGGGQGEGVARVGRGDLEGGHLGRQRRVVELHWRQARWRGQRRHIPGANRQQRGYGPNTQTNLEAKSWMIESSLQSLLLSSFSKSIIV